MKNFSLYITTIFSIIISTTACTTPQKPVATAQDKTAQGTSYKNLPDIELNTPILFSLIASDIAAQRGEPASAALTYLDLAKKTKDPRLAQQAYSFALQAGHSQLTQQSMQLWQRLAPDSLPIQNQEITQKLVEGKLLENQSQITTLINNGPQPPKALFNQIALSVSRQQDKVATARFIRSLAIKYPELPEAQFALVASAQTIQDDKTIDQAFDRLAKIAPDWDFPLAWYIDAQRKDHLDKTITLLKRELDRRPNAHYEIQITYPKLLITAKRYKDAYTAFETLLERTPNQPELLFMAGLLAQELKQPDDAINYLRRAALDNNYSEHDFIYYTLGQIYLNKQQPDEAKKWYKLIKPSSKQYLSSRLQLITIEAKYGDIYQAMRQIDILGKNKKLEMNIPEMKLQLAQEVGRKDIALSIINQILRKDPNNLAFIYQRAFLLDDMGDFINAEKDLRHYLKAKPEDPAALNSLGYILTIRTNRYDEAYDYIQKALKADPDNGIVMDSMGWVLFKKGEIKQSITYLKNAWSKEKDPEIAAHLGEVLYLTGNAEEAKRIWAEGIAKDAKHKVLLETLERYSIQNQ